MEKSQKSLKQYERACGVKFLAIGKAEEPQEAGRLRGKSNESVRLDFA